MSDVQGEQTDESVGFHSHAADYPLLLDYGYHELPCGYRFPSISFNSTLAVLQTCSTCRPPLLLSKLNYIFFGYVDPERISEITKGKKNQGDLTDISATTIPLMSPNAPQQLFVDSEQSIHVGATYANGNFFFCNNVLAVTLTTYGIEG